MAELLTTFEALERFKENTTLKELSESPSLLTAYELLQEEESRGSGLILAIENPEINKTVSRRINFPVPQKITATTASIYGLRPAGNGYVCPKRQNTRRQVWKAIGMLLKTSNR